MDLFSSYSSLIKSTQSMNIVYNDTKLLLNDELFYFENNQGCFSLIPTDASPTEEPDNRMQVYYALFVGDVVMNIIALFLLVLIIIFLIVKCVLNCYEDRRVLNEVQSGHLRSQKGQQSIEMTRIE